MHLAGTPSALSAKDWCILGEQTKGLSGSDLSNCTVDAMFEPMRELEANTSWKLNLGILNRGIQTLIFSTIKENHLASIISDLIKNDFR